MVAQVEILSEQDNATGWRFAAQVLDGEGTLHRHEIALSWADYNHWCVSGSAEPSAVAAAVLRFLLTKVDPESAPPRFDAATVRRRYADADAEIPRLIG
jgi:hypothetical protein